MVSMAFLNGLVVGHVHLKHGASGRVTGCSIYANAASREMRGASATDAGGSSGDESDTGFHLDHGITGGVGYM
jgi:hypothetical protein